MSRTRIPRALRARVRAVAAYRCGYCLSSEGITGLLMEVDHIVPEARGGLTEESNLWLACGACNEYKGVRSTAQDPESGEEVALFNPSEQSWNAHFAWTPDGTEDNRNDANWTGDCDRPSIESIGACERSKALGKCRLAPA